MAVWEYSHNNSTEITQKCQSCFGHSFFSRFSDLVYAAGRKEKRKKKHTEHEMVQFLGTTEHERGLTRTPHGEKHTLNTTGCSFEYHWKREGALHARHTVHSKVQQHIPHWKDVINYTKMNNYPSHADVRFGAFRCYVLLNASDCFSSSLLCGGVW